MSLLTVMGLTVDFSRNNGRERVVHGIDLDIAPGEVLAIVGESGSGKSVSAAAILGLLPERIGHASGSVTFESQSLLALDEMSLNKVRGQGIGIVFQNSLTSLDPSFRIGEQLVESIRYRRNVASAQAQDEAGQWLDRVGIRDVKRVLRAYPHELSGGMRQRVMIAIAIMSRPRLLIADEPTTALDPTIQKQVLDLLLEINRRDNTAILLITHDFGVVSYLSDRVAVMRAGQIVEHGRTEDVLGAPEHAYTRSLVDAVPDIGDRRGQGGHARRLGVVAPAQPLQEKVVIASPTSDVVLLELVGATKSFRVAQGFFGRGSRDVPAVRPTTLAIRQGEILGLIGESGSGKSTLARLAARLIDPSSGQIRYRGQDITPLTGSDLVPFRRSLQFVFQDSGASLNPRRTVASQLMDPVLRLGIAKNREQARVLAAQALGHVGLLPAHLDRYPHAFSGGQRQRIGIARALVVNPEFVILDEPTSALDVSIQAQVLNLLLSLREQFNLTYLFIGHNLPVIEFMCDRVAVMAQGEVVETFDADDLYANGKHPATTRLLEAVLPVNARGRTHQQRAAA